MPQPYKHSKTGVYYVRNRVPRELVDVVGKVEIKQSLRTKDPEEAKRVNLEVQRKLLARWHSLREGLRGLTERDAAGIAGIIYRERMEPVEEYPGPPEFADQFLRMTEAIGDNAALQEKWYGELVDRQLQQLGIATDASSRRRVIQATHRAWKRAAVVHKLRAEGDFSPDPNLATFPSFEADATSASSAGVTITELFDIWRKHHLARNGTARTVEENKRSVEAFKVYLGHEDATRVTSKNVSDFCDHLQFAQGLSGKTIVSKYLSALKATFKAGASSFRITHDPAAPVKRLVPREVRERSKGYTEEEAQRILEASLVPVPESSRMAAATKRALRWIPWICAYTGARVGEVAQLRKEDFREEQGIAYLRVSPEAGPVKTKSYRNIPIHSHLIDMGLLSMINSQPDGPIFYKSSTVGHSTVRSKAENTTKAVATWVRQSVGITDKRLRPNHAWRHRFSTIARDAGVELEYQHAIQGHSDGKAMH